MELTMTNQQLIIYTNFIQGVSAKGKEGRSIAKFIRLLQTKFEEYAADEMAIVKEYCQKDEDGKLLDEVNIIWQEDKKEIGENELAELKEEKVIIDLTEFKIHLDNAISAIENNDRDLTAKELLIFDELLTKLEKLKESD